MDYCQPYSESSGQLSPAEQSQTYSRQSLVVSDSRRVTVGTTEDKAGHYEPEDEGSVKGMDTSTLFANARPQLARNYAHCQRAWSDMQRTKGLEVFVAIADELVISPEAPVPPNWQRE